MHAELDVPMLARRRAVSENEPSRLTSQTLSGSSASASRERAASRASNLFEAGGDVDDSQICSERCCGEDRYRSGGDGDGNGGGSGGAAAAPAPVGDSGADGAEPAERSLRVVDAAVGWLGFTVVRRKFEPWTLAWDGLILLNTALIFFQNIKLEWLVPCSASAVAFEWISLLFLSLFVVELAVEACANGLRRFWLHNFFNRLDLVIVPISFVLTVVSVINSTASEVSVILFTVTFHANHAHNLTRSP